MGSEITKTESSYQLADSFDAFGSKHNEDAIRLCLERSLFILSSEQIVPEEWSEVIVKVRENLHAAKLQKPTEFTIGPYETTEMERLPDDQVIRYLYHRYRYMMNPVHHYLDDYPPCVQVELSSVCNFRCRFCYQSDKSFTGKAQGNMGVMDIALFKKVIDQLEGRVDFLTFASRGEPLLAPDFKEMMAYTREKFLSLKLNTNASRLTEELAHAILSSGVSTLVFSVDAAERGLYNRLRVRGDFELTKTNIERFQKIRQQYYPDARIVTRISGVMLDQDLQNMEDMVRVWGRAVDQISFVKYSPWEKIYKAPVNDLGDPCSDLWRRMFIWFDGQVSPCDNDYKATLAVGSILDRSVKELWSSEKYASLRNKHLNEERGTLEPCKRWVVS